MHRPVLERLEPLLVEGGVSAADLTATRLQILGGFRLVVGGEDRTPQPGHPTTLVKVLALRSTVTVDGAIDLLWPDADLAVGRTRLRNTLHRLKDRSGSIVVRDGETLRLAAGVAVDAGAHALALYTGDLLPGDLYEDWAAVPRERLQRRFVCAGRPRGRRRRRSGRPRRGHPLARPRHRRRAAGREPNGEVVRVAHGSGPAAPVERRGPALP